MKTLKEMRTAQAKIVEEIKGMIADGEHINFNEEKWFEPFRAEYDFKTRMSRHKYPRIVFAHIKKVRTGKETFPVPTIFELKCGMCHGNVTSVRHYEGKGYRVIDYFFPERSQVKKHKIGAYGIERQSSWQHKLHSEDEPWAEVAAYCQSKLGDDGAIEDLKADNIAKSQTNQTLTDKVKDLEKKLKKAEKDGNNNTDTKVQGSTETKGSTASTK